MSNGYNGWNSPLLVTLTETTNPYLAPKLPLRGLIRVLEMRTDHHAQTRRITFLQTDEAGNPIGTEVMVNDAAFTYTPPA